MGLLRAPGKCRELGGLIPKHLRPLGGPVWDPKTGCREGSRPAGGHWSWFYEVVRLCEVVVAVPLASTLLMLSCGHCRRPRSSVIVDFVVVAAVTFVVVVVAVVVLAVLVVLVVLTVLVVFVVVVVVSLSSWWRLWDVGASELLVLMPVVCCCFCSCSFCCCCCY